MGCILAVRSVDLLRHFERNRPDFVNPPSETGVKLLSDDEARAEYCDSAGLVGCDCGDAFRTRRQGYATRSGFQGGIAYLSPPVRQRTAKELHFRICE